MKHSTYTSYDELPLMLSVTEVAAVLGISRAGAYELVHGNEFPALKISSRIVVPKDKFLALRENGRNTFYSKSPPSAADWKSTSTPCF